MNEEVITPQADFDIEELTVVILSEGPARSRLERAEVQRLLNEHLAYTVGLVQAGKLLAAGALIDASPQARVTGLGFSRLPASELAPLEAEDPAMKADLEVFRVARYLFPKGAVAFPRERQEALERNKELSRRLYEEVFGAGRLEVADDIIAPECVNRGPGSPPSLGPDQIKRQAALLRTAISDLEANLNFQVAEGDRVASFWTGRGTHTGPLMTPAGQVAPTGNAISFDELRVDRYSGGRIVECWFIPDRMTLWSQFGLLPR